MKKHGHHGKKKRYGNSLSARVIRHGGHRPRAVPDSEASERREMLRGWLRVMSKADARQRATEIYGAEYVEKLEFLRENQ